MSELNSAFALSPLDGRYIKTTEKLRKITSEWGLMHYRYQVELAWLIFLIDHSGIAELSLLNPKIHAGLQHLSEKFTDSDFQEIKAFEVKTRHDVKAVEYFVRSKVEQLPEATHLLEFIHFACTSEDINNLAYALMLQAAHFEVILPAYEQLHHHLQDLARKTANHSMLARTHGQPATPTTMGKEIANFAYRIKQQIDQLEHIKFTGKFNGAVGNFNAHHTAYPDIDWNKLSGQFIGSLGLVVNPYTTQIEPHDKLAEYMHILVRSNNILLDFSKDIWSYISLNYFSQRPVSGEVGSSTMPHKINPIDFENAEGNLGLANCLFDFMASKLTQSRFQRDLSDSTVLRNMGVGLGHTLIAVQSLEKGLAKLDSQTNIMLNDLNAHPEILAEAVQTVMRRYALEAPYEQLKEFTRGREITLDSLHAFIKSTALPDDAKDALLALTPESYLGYAVSLAEKI